MPHIESIEFSIVFKLRNVKTALMLQSDNVNRQHKRYLVVSASAFSQEGGFLSERKDLVHVAFIVPQKDR